MRNVMKLRLAYDRNVVNVLSSWLETTEHKIRRTKILLEENRFFPRGASKQGRLLPGMNSYEGGFQRNPSHLREIDRPIGLSPCSSNVSAQDGRVEHLRSGPFLQRQISRSNEQLF